MGNGASGVDGVSLNDLRMNDLLYLLRQGSNMEKIMKRASGKGQNKLTELAGLYKLQDARKGMDPTDATLSRIAEAFPDIACCVYRESHEYIQTFCVLSIEQRKRYAPFFTPSFSYVLPATGFESLKGFDLVGSADLQVRINQSKPNWRLDLRALREIQANRQRSTMFSEQQKKFILRQLGLLDNDGDWVVGENVFKEIALEISRQIENRVRGEEIQNLSSYLA